MPTPVKTAKVRPFEEYIPQEEGFGAVVISGSIVGSSYLVKALGTQFALDTTEVSEDQWGAYAVVGECDVPLSGEFRLRLEVDADETVLDIYIPGDGVTGTSNWSKRSFNISFNASGKKDGFGSSLRGSKTPKPAASN